jgi:Leucine-rich repeat (LRR) protein
MLALPENGHFVETPNLSILDLSSCNLVEISKDAFCCAPNLEYIRLDSNKFETLNVSVFTEILADKVSTEECYASTTNLNKLAYLNISGNPLKCGCQFYKMRKFLENISVEYELQSSCGNTKYNISGVCSDKEMNQENEIASVKSEATISAVTTNVGENSSGSSVIISSALPSSEEGYPPNLLLQAMTNTVTRDVKTQEVSKVSTNVAKDVTEAIAMDNSDLITASFININVINVLLCVFILLTAVLFVLFLRQRTKYKRKNKLSSLTASQYPNKDCESDDLNHYEYIGNVPPNWTPFPRPVM